MNALSGDVKTVFRLALLIWLVALSPLATGAAQARPVPSSATRHTALRCPHRNATSGSITVSDSFLGPKLLPSLSYATGDLVLYTLLFDTLFSYDDHAHLFPMMATAIPTLKNGEVRNGGKTVVVHLKPGLRWSNGSEVTASDVKFGWQTGIDPAGAGSVLDCAGGCDVIKSIDTPDRYTAVFHLKRIDPGFAFNDAPTPWPKNGPAWKGNAHTAALALNDPSFSVLNRTVLTDGPFQAVSLNNNRMQLRPMKYYDDLRCGARVSKLVLTTYNTGTASTTASQVQAAISGKIDVGLHYSTSDIPALTRHASNYRVYVEPTFSFEHLELNVDPTYQGKPNPLANSKVRLALALATDKLAIIRAAVTLDAKQANNVVAWTPWVHTAHLLQPFADPKVTGQWDPLASRGKGAYVTNTGRGQALSDARRLLASTPWKHGFSLDMYTGRVPFRITEMAVIASQWSKLGVQVNQHAVGPGELFGSWAEGGILAHGAFQAGLFSVLGGPDPDPFDVFMLSQYIDRYDPNHRSDIDQNSSGIRDPVIDRAFGQALTTLSQGTRKRDFFTVQERVNQRAYWIPIYYLPRVSSSSKRMLNFKPTPIAALEGWNSYDWRVKG